MRRLVVASVVAAGGLIAVAASQGPAARPPMTAGKRYVVLTASEVKREVEAVEVLPGGWVRAKYTGSADKAERLVWLNLAQVVYFHPAGGD